MRHESHKTRIFYLETIVISGEVSPCLLKLFNLIFERRYHIVFIQVVDFKLLNNDEDEQVKHDECANHHVRNEEERAIGGAAVLPFDTSIGLGFHRVLHHAVPILSRTHTD